MMILFAIQCTAFAILTTALGSDLCKHEIVKNVTLINKIDIPMKESQKEREASCIVGIDYNDIDIYGCDEYFGEAVKLDCILCGKSIGLNSQLRPLCSNKKDNPDTEISCSYCKNKVRPCLNNGIGNCPPGEAYASEFKCDCPHGFNGTWCENRITTVKVNVSLTCNCSDDVPLSSKSHCDVTDTRPCYISIRNNTVGCSCYDDVAGRSARKCLNLKQIEDSNDHIDAADFSSVVKGGRDDDANSAGYVTSASFWRLMVLMLIKLTVDT